MTPEELATKLECTAWPHAAAAAAYLRRVRPMELEISDGIGLRDRLAALEAENARWREWWFAQGHRGYPPPEDLLREALEGGDA